MAGGRKLLSLSVYVYCFTALLLDALIALLVALVTPFVTEFARDGAIVFDARLPKGGQSYRAFRFPWVGRPSGRPALVARGGMLYASWNGATEVASWRVLGGETVARAGFETVVKPPPNERRAVVDALDRTGAVLGRTASVAL